MTDFIGGAPSEFVEGGFLTGRQLTIGGVRTSTTDFNGKLKEGSTRACLQFFYTEIGRDGEKRIQSAYPLPAAWGDQLQPSDNKKGFVAAPGATKPGIEKNSDLGAYLMALVTAGCPAKLLASGNYQKLVGTVVVLGEKEMEIRKKSVDPGEKKKADKRTIEVPVQVVTLPADNPDYKGLTEKEIDAYLADLKQKSEAKRAARGEGGEIAGFADPEAEAEPEAEEAPKKKKGGFADDDDDQPTTKEPEEDNSDDELAASLVIKVLKKEKGAITGAVLLQKVYPLVAGMDKKQRAAVLEKVQDGEWVATVDGVSVNGNKVKLG